MSGQPVSNSSSSSHLPYNGSTIPKGTDTHRSLDLKLSFDTQSDFPSSYPDALHSSPLPNLKPAHSVSEIYLSYTDDGIEHEINPDKNHIQPLVDRRSGSSFFHSLIPPSIACRLYLSVVLLETFIDLVIEGMILARVNSITRNTETSPTDGTVLIGSQLPVLLAIFCLAHVFQFAFALDAVHHQNVLQFIFLAIFNALFFVRIASLSPPFATKKSYLAGILCHANI